jgi:hypothetical protein
MPRLTTEVYQSLMDALLAHCEKTGEPLRHFVSRALSEALGLDHSTLFQVSTTGALVQGVYNEAVTVGGLRTHGDFGLGTFEFVEITRSAGMRLGRIAFQMQKRDERFPDCVIIVNNGDEASGVARGI